MPKPQSQTVGTLSSHVSELASMNAFSANTFPPLFASQPMDCCYLTVDGETGERVPSCENTTPDFELTASFPRSTNILKLRTGLVLFLGSVVRVVADGRCEEEKKKKKNEEEKKWKTQRKEKREHAQAGVEQSAP